MKCGSSPARHCQSLRKSLASIAISGKSRLSASRLLAASREGLCQVAGLDMPDNGKDIAIRAIAGQPGHFIVDLAVGGHQHARRAKLVFNSRGIGRQGCAERGKSVSRSNVRPSSSLCWIWDGKLRSVSPRCARPAFFPLQESSAIFGNMVGEFWACPLSKAVSRQKIGQARLCPGPAPLKSFSRQGLASFAPGAPQSPADCQKGPLGGQAFPRILAAAPHRPNRHDAQIAIRGQHFFHLAPQQHHVRCPKSGN